MLSGLKILNHNNNPQYNEIQHNGMQHNDEFQHNNKLKAKLSVVTLNIMPISNNIIFDDTVPLGSTLLIIGISINITDV